MKKYLFYLIVLLLSLGCATINNLEERIETLEQNQMIQRTGETGLNIDVDSNNCVDKEYGGTNQTSVPGADTYVIYNDGGEYGADSGITINDATDSLTAVGTITGATVTTSGSAGVITCTNSGTAAVDAAGEFCYDSGAAEGARWKFFDTTKKTMADTSSTQTLTNKTIDADDNSINDVPETYTYIVYDANGAADTWDGDEDAFVMIAPTSGTIVGWDCITYDYGGGDAATVYQNFYICSSFDADPTNNCTAVETGVAPNCDENGTSGTSGMDNTSISAGNWLWLSVSDDTNGVLDLRVFFPSPACNWLVQLAFSLYQATAGIPCPYLTRLNW